MIFSIVVVLISLYIVIMGLLYLLVKRSKLNRWGIPMKVLFYFGFSISCIVIVWEISLLLR